MRQNCACNQGKSQTPMNIYIMSFNFSFIKVIKTSFTFLSPGPPTWGNIAPAAKGKRQSPIDIVPSQAKFDKTLKEKPLRMTYDPSKAKELINTGASVQVPYDPAGSCEYMI